MVGEVWFVNVSHILQPLVQRIDQVDGKLTGMGFGHLNCGQATINGLRQNDICKQQLS
jgi:hypothetical protein